MLSIFAANKAANHTVFWDKTMLMKYIQKFNNKFQWVIIKTKRLRTNTWSTVWKNPSSIKEKTRLSIMYKDDIIWHTYVTDVKHYIYMYSRCNILDTRMCLDDFPLLKIMYISGLNGPMRSKGTLTTLGGGGVRHMGQFNSDMGLDWSGIHVHGSNNPPRKLFFAFLAFMKSSHYHVPIITNKIFMCLCTG
jgi:hypothetical protein